MTSLSSKNWLNIVSKHRIALLIVLTFLFVAMFALILTPTTGAVPAYDSGTDPSKLVKKCKEIVPSKAKEVCAGEYLRKAYNVASHHCSGAKSPESCTIDKAASYFEKAVKKDPTPSGVNDFQKNLKKVFDDVGGDPDEPAEWTSTFEGDECPPGTNECVISSTVDPAACTAAARAKQPLPQGCSAEANQTCTSDSCDLIKKYVNPAMQVVTAMFGLIAVASLILGGIQYSSSAGDPQKVTEAKKRISNTLLAIIAYLLLYSFLQFLIPGGLFQKP